MNALDIILSLILLVSFFYGMYRGLIMELAGLAGIALGLWGAIHFGHSVEDWLGTDYAGRYTGVASFLILFIVITFVVHFLAAWINRILTVGILGTANRITGGIFALLKTALIVSCLCYALNYADAQGLISLPTDTVQQSRLYPIISDLAPAIFPYLNFDMPDLSDLPGQPI